jgi:hypothetical protein
MGVEIHRCPVAVVVACERLFACHCRRRRGSEMEISRVAREKGGWDFTWGFFLGGRWEMELLFFLLLSFLWWRTFGEMPMMMVKREREREMR